MKIRIHYTPYERYSDCSPVIGHVIAPTVEEALFKALEKKINVYTWEGFQKEFEEDLGRKATVEDIIKKIEDCNGDGCDYVHSIVNEETGEEIFKAGDVEFEEWTLE